MSRGTAVGPAVVLGGDAAGTLDAPQTPPVGQGMGRVPVQDDRVGELDAEPSGRVFARDPTGEGVQDDDQVVVVFGAGGVFFLLLRTRDRQGDVTLVGAGDQVRVHRAVVAVALRDAGVPGAGTAIAPQGGAVDGIECSDAI